MVTSYSLKTKSGSSETSRCGYKTTRRKIAEDGNCRILANYGMQECSGLDGTRGLDLSGSGYGQREGYFEHSSEISCP